MKKQKTSFYKIDLPINEDQESKKEDFYSDNFNDLICYFFKNKNIKN
jgi:hypothetical protein